MKPILRAHIFLLAALSLLVGCGKSQKQTPVTDQELDQLVTSGRSTAKSDQTRSFALASDPAVVSVTSNTTDGSASWLLFNTDKMPAVPTDQLDQAALAAADTYGDLLAITAADLYADGQTSIQQDSSTVAVIWRRHYQGLEVRDAHVQFLFSCDQDCRLREIVNNSYGAIDIANAGEVPAPAEAIESQSYLQDWQRSQQIPKRFVLAKDTDRDGVLEFYRVSEYQYGMPGTNLTYGVVVPDGAVRPLEAYSNRFALSYQVTADVHDKQGYIDNSTAEWPIGLTPVINGNDEILTNLDGIVDIEDLDNNPTIELNTSRLRMINANEATVTLDLVEEGRTGLAVDLSNDVAFRNANSFSQVQRVIRHIQQFVTPGDIAILDQPTEMQVDYTPQNPGDPSDCNAFFQPQLNDVGFIALYPAGNGCANISLLPDVIFHEFGHGVDHTSGPASGPGRVGIADGASSEAFGDIISLLMTGSPMLAPGFRQNSPNGLRDLTANRVFPDDLDPQGLVHVDGLIFGSTMYDLYRAMIERYGEDLGAYETGRLFYRHLLVTDSYRDSYQAILRLDDDDGNPATRSPNHCLINEIFAAHGLAISDNCQDQVETPEVESDSDIVLAVNELDGRDIVFMASAPERNAIDDNEPLVMTLCEESLENCLEDADSQTVMLFDGLKEDRALFVAEDGISPTNLEFVTVVLWETDRDGDPTTAIGYRRFLWSAK